MFLLLIGSFIAGILTVLAPCVLPLLPVIIGGSIRGGNANKRRPYIIAASLAVSLILFTILLKATTLLIDIPPQVFTYVSGAILILLGIAFLFPSLYERFILAFNLQAKSQQLLGKSRGKGPIIGAIITGAALGPVFSSCSPVYAYILATVLPVRFAEAMLYILAYVLGLAGMLLLVGILGRRVIGKIKFASNPRGWFNRSIAIVFIVVGLLVLTGTDKQLQTYISEHTPFNFDALSAKLIPSNNTSTSSSGVLNVKPYRAPDFRGIDSWINSKPLHISDLKGKVVLVDFWTYSCINCIRTQPYLKGWYKLYHDSGFEIVGVHAPEFAFERVKRNVENAAKDAGLTYPIALDNSFATWNAYQNQYWPASYLIDAEGNVRRFHAGEGKYKEGEDAIRTLLTDAGNDLPDKRYVADDNSSKPVQHETPETYLGSSRASNYVGKQPLINGKHTFSPERLERVNDWTLSGSWDISSEGITSGKNAELSIRFAAKNLYLVTGNSVSNKRIKVELQAKQIPEKLAGEDVKNGFVSISAAQLYKLVRYSSFRSGDTLTLHVPAGVQLNVLTFSS